MVKPILYGIDLSPPVRACLITAKAIGLDIDYRQLDLFQKREHLTEEYLKKNPQHTVPLLEDNGKCIWDSHAICGYLVSKYAKDDKLYPKNDHYKCALIDQRLHFDSGVLFPSLRNVSIMLFRKHDVNIPQEYFDKMSEAYDFLEKFLEVDLYLVGNDVTIADFCTIATITAMQNSVKIENNKYPKLSGWIKRMEQLPYYKETNGDRAQKAAEFVKGFIEKIKTGQL